MTFTGDDPGYPRDQLVARAVHFGLMVGGNVTKQTDFLVAADVTSTSGKAAKARSFSVPIISAAQFATVGLGTEIEAHTTALEAKKVVQCPDCHTTWTVSARSGAQSTRRCNDCAGTVSQSPKRPAAMGAGEPPAIEVLSCADCGQSWTRERVRGRKPQRCPDCAAGPGRPDRRPDPAAQ